jgi:hypothetical protein
MFYDGETPSLFNKNQPAIQEDSEVTITMQDSNMSQITLSNTTDSAIYFSVSDDKSTAIDPDTWFNVAFNEKYVAELDKGDKIKSSYRNDATLLRVLVWDKDATSGDQPVCGGLANITGGTSFNVEYHFGGEDSGPEVLIPSTSGSPVVIQSTTSTQFAFVNQSLESWKIACENDNQYGVNWDQTAWDRTVLADISDVSNMAPGSMEQVNVNGGATAFKILVWPEDALGTDQASGGVLVDASDYSVLDTWGTLLTFTIDDSDQEKKIELKDDGTPTPRPKRRVERWPILKYILVALAIIALLLIFSKRTRLNIS